MIASVSALVLLAAVGTLAAPAPSFQKTSFRAVAEKNPNYVPNGPAQLFKAYRKYGIPIPDDLQRAVDRVKLSGLEGKWHHTTTKRHTTTTSARHHHTSSTTTKKTTTRKTTSTTSHRTTTTAKTTTTSSVKTTTTATTTTAGHAGTSGVATAVPAPTDLEYSVKVAIGTPPQYLNLDFDTGSSDLWVFSSSLSSSKKAGHNVYDFSKSSSYTPYSAGSWSIQYGDGSTASGKVGYDVVNVGGVSFPKQAVEYATTISSSFVSDTDVDGLLGLGFSNINTVQPQSQKTFFDNVAGTLANPLFTADLRHDENGSYDFGFIDDSLYTGDLNKTSVDASSGWWQFPVNTGYYVGGTFKSAKSNSGSNVDGIFDTGTTLLLVTDQETKDYYAAVSDARYDSDQGGYIFPCNAKLPDLQVAVGDKYAYVLGEYINFAPVDGTNCFGGVQSVGTTEFPLIYGDILFKSNFVVFGLGSGGSTSSAYVQWGLKPEN